MKTFKQTLTKGIRNICSSLIVIILTVVNVTSVFAAEETSKDTSYIEVTEQAFESSEGTSKINGIIYSDNLNGLLRGTKPPTGKSFVDLNDNTLTCNAKELTVSLYSNSFFSGVSKVEVSIAEISIDKNGAANKSGPVTVHLKKKGDRSVDVTGTIPTRGGSVYYKNLDSNALYYLEFSKNSDKQIYSFKANITKY